MLLNLNFKKVAPLFIISFFASSLLVTADTTTDSFSEKDVFEKPTRPVGAVNCFDYYHFGSVEVDASPTTGPDTISGKNLTFKGQIKNSNPYPIVDGQVYVKIFKKEKISPDLLRLNSYPIVDFFLVKDDISLGANQDQDISFDWKIPTGAGGEYQAAFYFTSAHRYNLLGLSFTDDVTGNKSNFTINSVKGSIPPVVFDKNSILLNKNAYHPATFLQHFKKDEPVTVYTTLKNESSVEKSVQVEWVTSKWDGILSSHEQKREVVSVVLKPKESKKISYLVPTVESSVTFIEATVKDGDAKSILHIRFSRDGHEEVRINFPSIVKYPMSQSKENTLFSCVHSTNAPIVEGNTLTLTLKDDSGKVIHTYTYKGNITKEMMGVKDSFAPTEELYNFSLTAKLEHNGTVVDEVTMKYDCDKIDKSLCPKPNEIITNGNTGANNINMTYILVISAVLLLFVGGGYYTIKKKGGRKNLSTGSDTSSAV